jgi:hypothetical protein
MHYLVTMNSTNTLYIQKYVDTPSNEWIRLFQPHLLLRKALACFSMTMPPCTKWGPYRRSLEELDWPAQRPDLNPIGHLWDELEHWLRARPNRPTSVPDLTNALAAEWKQVPAAIFQHQVESLPRRGVTNSILMPVILERDVRQAVYGLFNYLSTNKSCCNAFKQLKMTLLEPSLGLATGRLEVQTPELTRYKSVVLPLNRQLTHCS